MNVYILTSHDFFDFVYETTYSYKDKHQIHISTQPYVFLAPYDVGISFMHIHKVPAEQVNKHPWFNFHPAPLPEYKGRNLCYHAIMNGETEFGATVHYMDENFDTGDIIDVWFFYMENTWTAQDLYDRTILESQLMFKHFFPRILAGEEFIRLKNIGGRYYKKEPIKDYIEFPSHLYFARVVRAITFGKFHPKIDVNGVTYKIVRDE